MVGYAVRVDLSEVLAAHSDAVLAMFPRLAQAVALTSEYGAGQWRDAVMKARLWQGEKEKYVESITWRMVGQYEAEIKATYRLADEIETGRPERDLKKVLQTSTKTRISKNPKHAGQKYLIIPFRHNTPGHTAHARAMPADIYAAAKALTKTVMLPPGTKRPARRLSASGHFVGQHSYQWGGALPAGLAPKLKEHHTVDIYARMVRMETSAGGARSSAYLTFRTMGEWSQHWLVPPKPGLYIVRDVSAGLQPLLEKAVGKAVSMGVGEAFS